MISSLRRLGVEDKTHALGTEATHGQMELRVKSGNALRNRLGVYTRSTVDAFRPLLLSRSRHGSAGSLDRDKTAGAIPSRFPPS